LQSDVGVWPASDMMPVGAERRRVEQAVLSDGDPGLSDQSQAISAPSSDRAGSTTELHHILPRRPRHRQCTRTVLWLHNKLEIIFRCFHVIEIHVIRFADAPNDIPQHYA
jgi:hypothetical protein